MNVSPSRRLPKRPTLTLIAILCLLGASCGINVDQEAQVVPGAAEELQRPDAANQPVGNSGSFKVLLYFPGPEDNFYAVQQSFPTAPNVNDILDGIANNPVGLEELERDIDDQAAAQQLKLITTSVNDQMDPKTGAFDPTTGNLIVNMSAEANLAEVTPERRTEIFTQIVCTLTQKELKIEINSIEIFEIDGDEELQIFAQDASGARNEGPSTRDDYACEDATVLAVPTVESDTQTKRALERKEANG